MKVFLLFFSFFIGTSAFAQSKLVCDFRVKAGCTKNGLDEACAYNESFPLSVKSTDYDQHWITLRGYTVVLKSATPNIYADAIVTHTASNTKTTLKIDLRRRDGIGGQLLTIEPPNRHEGHLDISCDVR